MSKMHGIKFDLSLICRSGIESILKEALLENQGETLSITDYVKTGSALASHSSWHRCRVLLVETDSKALHTSIMNKLNGLLGVVAYE